MQGYCVPADSRNKQTHTQFMVRNWNCICSLFIYVLGVTLEPGFWRAFSHPRFYKRIFHPPEIFSVSLSFLFLSLLKANSVNWQLEAGMD